MLFQWQNKVQRGKPHCPQLRHRFDHLRLCISFLSHQHGCKKRRCPKNSTFFYLVTYIQTREMLLLLFPDLTRPSIVFAQLVPRLGIILRLKGERHSKAVSTNSYVFFVEIIVVNCFFYWTYSGEFEVCKGFPQFASRKRRTCRTSQERSDCLSRSEASLPYSRLTLRILRFLSHKVLGFKISYC